MQLHRQTLLAIDITWHTGFIGPIMKDQRDHTDRSVRGNPAGSTLKPSRCVWPIARRLLRVASLASASLLVVVLVLGARSFWVCDSLYCQEIRPVPESPEIAAAEISLNRGILCLARDRAFLPAKAFESQVQIMEAPATGWLRRASIPAMEFHRVPTRFGFGVAERSWSDLGIYRSLCVVVPLWALLIPLTVLPAIELIRVKALMRHRRRRMLGQCADCGYDLRATPGRCPECGAVPEAAPAVHWRRDLLQAGLALALVCGCGFTLRTCGRAHARQQKEIWLQQRASITQAWEFVAAAERGDYGAVVAALDRGVSPDATDFQGMTALHRAAEGNHTTVATLLLSRGAKPDVPNPSGAPTSPLCQAIEHANRDLVELLLTHGADVRDKGRGPLHVAVAAEPSSDSDVILRLLMAKGADLNGRDDDGDTPLHVATVLGNTEHVRVLLEGGADPTIRNGDGQTPLDLVAGRGHVEIVKLLSTRQRQKEEAQQPK